MASAVGILLSLGSAQAADLGGNCCADLEERVAELEATTARKGNRKVSLKITGQVNRAVMWFDNAGVKRGYAGIDNTSSSSRFWFTGEAKIRSDLKAGYEMMLEWAGDAKTSAVTEKAIDSTKSGDGNIGVRTANWYLDHNRIGRVTVGRLNAGGPVATIDLGGVGVVAPNSPALIGGGMNTAGVALSSLLHPTIGSDRIEGIRYDTANIYGFSGQATWGEGDVWTASLRWAQELAGFQLAAGIGWQGNHGSVALPDGGLDTSSVRESEAWAASLAMRHVASGIFAQGMWTESKYKAGLITSGDGTKTSAQTFTADFWQVQAGLARNFTGAGNTAFYGEVGRGNDYGRVVANVSDTNSKYWGLGVVQNLDMAATELYLGYRSFENDVTKSGVKAKGDLDIVTAGARIKF